MDRFCKPKSLFSKNTENFSFLLSEFESQHILANVISSEQMIAKRSEGGFMKKFNFFKAAQSFAMKHIKKRFPSRHKIEEQNEDGNHELDIHFLPLTMLPNLVIEEMVCNLDGFMNVPVHVRYKAILFVVDVSGFTQLTEMYNKNELTGADDLAVELNDFMSNLALMIMNFGGDILSFAGDAYLCQWEQSEKERDIKVLAKYAYQCAVYIQTMPYSTISKILRVKIAIAVGEVTTTILGSPSDFLSFVVVGSVIEEVRTAEEHCKPGEIVLSENVYNLLARTDVRMYKKTFLEDNCVKITDLTVDINVVPLYSQPNRIKLFEKCGPQQLTLAKYFMLPILRELTTIDQLTYISEVTQVTILFLLLPNIDIAHAANLDVALRVILLYVQKYEGVMNKVLLFDKGCTFLLVFGFPGSKHINDASRAILCAEATIIALEAQNLEATSGLSTGTCFCGLVGHSERREYTVIGWRVNLACRLMTTYSEKVVLDANTYHSSRCEIEESSFKELKKKKLKGIKTTPDIYHYDPPDKPLEKVVIKKSQIFGEKILLNLSEDERTIHNLLNSFNKGRKIEELKKKDCWPVVFFQGANGCGKSYLHNYATHAAMELDFEVISFTAVPQYINDPFNMVSLILLHFLKIYALKETSWIEALNKFIPMETNTYLFVLNHLLDLKVPIPVSLDISIDDLYLEIEKFLKSIFHKIFSWTSSEKLFLNINDAQNLDPYSWKLVSSIAETENVVIFLTVPLNYMVSSTSAAIVYLRSYRKIYIERLSHSLIPAILCWYLNVDYVHKDVVNILKAQNIADSQHLENFMNSQFFESIVKIVKMETINRSLLETIFFPHRKLLSDENRPISERYVCDVYTRLTNILESIPGKENLKVLRKLDIQNRMIVKRAAVLGYKFTWNELCIVNSNILTFELESCFRTLLNKKVLSFAFDEKSTKDVTFVAKKHATIFSVQIEDRYIATKVKELNFENPISLMQKIKFVNRSQRAGILEKMTKSQRLNMYLAVTNSLIDHGLTCISCRGDIHDFQRAASSSGMYNEKGDSRKSFHILSMDLRKCHCIAHKIEKYELISEIFKNGGMLLLSMKYLIYAAEICIEDRNPIKALGYVEYGLQIIHFCFTEDQYVPIAEETELLPRVLKGSLYRIQAEAFYYLGNIYKAGAAVMEALFVLKMNIMDAIGNYPNKDLYCFSVTCGELERKEIASCILVLCKTYYKTAKYEIACQLSILCNKLMASCNSTFIKVLSALCLHFKCRTKLEESLTVHKRTQEKILYSCHFRLTHFASDPVNVLELRAIARAYIVVMVENLNQRKFNEVERIGQEAYRIFRCVYETVFTPIILSLIIEACRLNRQFELLSVYLNRFRSYALESADKGFIVLLYAEEIKLLDMLGELVSSIQKYELKQCEEFMVTPASHFFHLHVPYNICYFASSNFALWCLISKPIVNYEQNSQLFIRWYRNALKLRKMSMDSHWHVSAELTMKRIDIIISFVVKNYSVEEKKQEYYRILDELKKLFVHIRFNYPALEKMWRDLIDEFFVVRQEIFSPEKGTWTYRFEKFIHLIESEMVLFTSY